MVASALWRTLYAPGHDAALVTSAGEGFVLEGMAVFHDERGPVAARYRVEMDSAWRALAGSVEGFAGETSFNHRMERTGDGWVLDGKAAGLPGIVDLDFGFTPATNFQQLKRAGLGVGEAAEFSVAWFDIGKASLTALPQRYERRDATHYWYRSPQNEYEAMLVIAENGFVRLYPELWEMEG